MSSNSVCQVLRSWVDVGSFHTRLVMRFMNITASVWNILDGTSYVRRGYNTQRSQWQGVKNSLRRSEGRRLF
jgi:hypothetical protein